MTTDTTYTPTPYALTRASQATLSKLFKQAQEREDGPDLMITQDMCPD